MSNIQVGNTVVRDGFSEDKKENLFTVVGRYSFLIAGKRSERLWLEDHEGQDAGSHLAGHCRKVEPKFEVGKTYRRTIDMPMLFTVVSVHGSQAMGWSGEGHALVTSSPYERAKWEEVGVSINADQHKNLRKMGIIFHAPEVSP